MVEYDEDDLALPNVVFNVRQGNSLIGFTELMETKGEENGDGSQQAALSSWGPDSVQAKYGNIISLVAKHKRASGSEEAMEYLHEAEDLLEEYRRDLDEKIVDEFHEAGIEDATFEQVRDYEPFHWVLEFATVYADGRFDVIAGNPPWDVLRTNRDDYFARFNARFRSQMPAEKDQMMNRLLGDESIADGWDEYRREMQMRADYFNDTNEYELQSPIVDGRQVTAENDLSMLFTERAFKIGREGGHISLVLPNVIFTGSSGKAIRQNLLDKTTIDSILHFENHGIFSEIDDRYRFGVLTFENSGRTESLRGIFFERDLDVIERFEERTVTIPRPVLKRYSPEAALFPQVSSKDRNDSAGDAGRQVEALETIIAHPPLETKIDGRWTAVSHRELDRTYDADRFVENTEEGDYPVYGGKNIYQFVHDETYLNVKPPELWSVEEDRNSESSAKSRIREKEVRNLKSALYNALNGTGTQKGFVNGLLEEHRGEPLSEGDVLLDCTEYRLVFRDIANTTNERTFIAAVIPPGVVCHSKLRTVRPYHIDPQEHDLSEKPLHSVYRRDQSDRELFVILGLFNSLPFDHLMRTKVDNVIVDYKFRESQMPRLTDGNDWFHYIADHAARLNCYGEAFAEMRERLGGIDPATEEGERRRLQAEIDAAAFHAYGLDREETKFVLDDFHRVQSPRVMTEEYFDSVLQYYEELAESGPMP